MTKSEAFQRDEAKRDLLRNALPVVLEALEAIKADKLEAGHVNEGVVNPNIGNSYYQQIVGAKLLITSLPGLTEVYKAPKPLPGRRLFTEEDRDFLKQQQEEK